MVLQRHDRILAGLLIFALSIVVVPVSADISPDSGSPLLVADNFTPSDQPVYTFSVLNEVSPDSGSPVLMIVNSTSSGQTLHILPAPTDFAPGSGGPALMRDGSPPSGRALYPEPVRPDDPPDSGDLVPAPVKSTISRDTMDAAPVSGFFDSVSPGESLQHAIDIAADGDTIYLDPGTYYEHGITVSKNITIRANESAGGNRDNTIIDAEQADRIFTVAGAYSLAIDNLTLQNATVSYNGGAVYAPSGGTLTISSSTFSNCSANSGSGGAILVWYGTVNVTSSTFLNCSATYGGAIYSYRSTVDVTFSTFSNCSAGWYSGAIYARLSTVNVTSTTFVNCSATYYGGAIYTDTSTVNVKSSTFTNCSTTHSGGAIRSEYGTFSVTSSTFLNCSASYDGGAIYSNYGTFNVTSSTFSNCTASWEGGAIYTYSSTVDIISTTFSNCSATYYGGAILTMYGIVNVTSSTFSNCSTSYYGGAIYVAAGTFTITTSSFSNCSVTYYGGAVMSAGTLTITSSAFTNCSAGYGGAISSVFSTVNVTSSSFSNCSASLGGAIFLSHGTATINSSTFSDCPADNGGAIDSNTEGILTVHSSSFFNCSANTGGAIINFGNATIGNNSVFTDCSAVGGGAIYNGGSTFTITSTSFSDCSAAIGGAILSGSGTITITSSTFTTCSADQGGAIWTMGIDTIHFSRFYKNTATIAGPAVFTFGTVNATNNWWGTNSDPSGFVHGDVDYTPWLVLGITASPSSITTAQTSTIRTNLTFNSSGYDTSGGGVYVPANITNTFAITAGSGSVSPLTNGMVNGVAGTTFTPASAGTSNISAMVDDQTVFINLTVARAAPTVTAITPGTGFNFTGMIVTNITGTGFQHGSTVVLMRAGQANISATNIAITGSTQIICRFPMAGAEAGVWDVVVKTPDGREGVLARGFRIVAIRITITIIPRTTTPVPTTRVTSTAAPIYSQYPSGDNNDDGPPAIILPMTMIVNIGGNSAAGKATVTGTKLAELIVTGTVQSGTGSNLTAPSGIVYQYISLVPARFTTITNAVINFSVPQSWLDENHIAPGSIVMYRQTSNGWEALPTTMLYAKDGMVYYSAQSTGFSLFAIAGTPTSQTPVTTGTTQINVRSPVQQQVPAAVAKAPGTTQTTAAPAPAQQPTGFSGFPFMTAALIGAGCIVLIGGGWYVRRWWIQRQNPALFQKYD